MALKAYGVDCELNLIDGAMTVRTTKKMWDPYAIIKARDLVKLLARSIPINQALRALEDGMFNEVVKIKNMVRNKERFIKRRDRLIGPNGCTLKAIELVTDCYVLVQGNTVSVMGSHKNIQIVRKIILDCMNNIHPIYRIKELMIRKELEKDPLLKNENWDRFIPKIQKKNVNGGKKKVVREEKEYTPFPPTQTPRKVDLEMESGEYWTNQDDVVTEELKNKEKIEKAEKRRRAKEERKAAEFAAPAEKSHREVARDIIQSGGVEKALQVKIQGTLTNTEKERRSKKRHRDQYDSSDDEDEKPAKHQKTENNSTDKYAALKQKLNVDKTTKKMSATDFFAKKK